MLSDFAFFDSGDETPLVFEANLIEPGSFFFGRGAGGFRSLVAWRKVCGIFMRSALTVTSHSFHKAEIYCASSYSDLFGRTCYGERSCRF